jgi:hypothetical protein
MVGYSEKGWKQRRLIFQGVRGLSMMSKKNELALQVHPPTKRVTAHLRRLHLRI